MPRFRTAAFWTRPRLAAALCHLPHRRFSARSGSVARRAMPCYLCPMLVNFFHELKSAGVPVTLREYLTLMEAMDQDLAGRRVEDFYYLARAALVKDERNLDKFDRVFGHVFKGLELMSETLTPEIPAAWLKRLPKNTLPRRKRERSTQSVAWTSS